MRAGGVDADEIGFGYHLDVIGAAPAHPAVGHADDGDTARRRLGDRGAGSVIHREHANIAAAVERDREFGLVHGGHWPSRLSETRMLGDVQDLGQPRILIAAQRRIDHMIGED
jgi:hypothetical protein